MIQQKKINVMLGDDRTSITINPHVLELAKYLDGSPEIQDLIDEAVDEYGMNPDGNASAWVTSLVAVAAAKQLEEWGSRI